MLLALVMAMALPMMGGEALKVTSPKEVNEIIISQTNGEPASHIVMASEKNGEWYVGAMTQR